MRLVLDTNVLISGIFWKGPPHDVLVQIEEFKQYHLTQSEETLSEFKNVIRRGKFEKILKKRSLSADIIIESLIQMADLYFISPSTHEFVKNNVTIKDRDDLKFIELAIESHSQYIISGDPHLLHLKNTESIPILTPVQFLNTLMA